MPLRRARAIPSRLYLQRTLKAQEGNTLMLRSFYGRLSLFMTKGGPLTQTGRPLGDVNNTTTE